METYTEAKNSTEKHFFTTNEDKKRNARLSREKTKNKEPRKKLDKTQARSFIYKKKPIKIHKHTRDNL